MTKVQSYLFYEVLRAVAIIVGGLALLALLAQGLSLAAEGATSLAEVRRVLGDL